MQMIRRRALAELTRAPADADLAVSEIRRTDRISRGPRPSRSPNFLSHLKQLALGE
jgi:hypothetical protein